MLRRLALLLFMVLVIFTAPAIYTAERGWTPDQILKVKRVGPVVPSPDGSRVGFVVSDAVMEGEKSE